MFLFPRLCRYIDYNLSIPYQSQKVRGTLMEITANKEKKKVYQDEFLSFISLLRIAAGRAGRKRKLYHR